MGLVISRLSKDVLARASRACFDNFPAVGPGTVIFQLDVAADYRAFLGQPADLRSTIDSTKATLNVFTHVLSFCDGADRGTRTLDLLITNQLL